VGGCDRALTPDLVAIRSTKICPTSPKHDMRQ